MNEIEKIDYIYGAIKGTLWAIENDIGNMPQWELENCLELLKDLREPLFQELKKDIEGWDSMAQSFKKMKCHNCSKVATIKHGTLDGWIYYCSSCELKRILTTRGNDNEKEKNQ